MCFYFFLPGVICRQPPVKLPASGESSSVIIPGLRDSPGSYGEWADSNLDAGTGEINGAVATGKLWMG